MEITFTGTIWKYSGEGAWYFISLPQKYTSELKNFSNSFARSFGSIKVEAEIVGITWRTSIFPDTKSNAYILPVKKEIRTKAALVVDVPIKLKVTILHM